MELKNRNIFIISNEPWGLSWFSKHNYAYELSRMNHVIFADPSPRWSPPHILSCNIRLKNISNNLAVLQYRNLFPSFTSWLFRLNNILVSRRIKKFLDKNDFNDIIFWSFDPVRLSNPSLFEPRVSIFQVMDQFNLKFRGEKQLSRLADFIFCVSGSFVPAYQAMNRNVHVIPHAISTEEFISHNGFVQQGSALYIGGIDDRLDFGLIEKMLVAFPDVRFTFIGKQSFDPKNPIAARIFLDKQYPNGLVLGEKPFKELKEHISRSAFCIAPMKKDHPGNAISHHKILQYLALGKPVFSTRFSEYENIGHLLYMDDDPGQLVRRMDAFLNDKEDTMLALKRIEYAKQFTFEVTLNGIAGILSLKK